MKTVAGYRETTRGQLARWLMGLLTITVVALIAFAVLIEVGVMKKTPISLRDARAGDSHANRHAHSVSFGLLFWCAQRVRGRRCSGETCSRSGSQVRALALVNGPRRRLR